MKTKLILHLLLAFVEVCAIAAMIVIPAGDVKRNGEKAYSKPGEKLVVRFSDGQDALLKRIERIDVFCGTKSEPNPFKTAGQRVPALIDKLPRLEAAVAPETSNSRMEFVYKNNSGENRVWPKVELLCWPGLMSVSLCGISDLRFLEKPLDGVAIIPPSLQVRFHAGAQSLLA